MQIDSGVVCAVLLAVLLGAEWLQHIIRRSQLRAAPPPQGGWTRASTHPIADKAQAAGAGWPEHAEYV